MKMKLFFMAGCFLSAVALSGCSITNGLDQKTFIQERASETPAEIPDNKDLTVAQSSSQQTQNQPAQSQSEENLIKEPEDLSLLEKYESAVIKTNLGDIKIEFFTDQSPKTVNNFFYLAESNFYDGTKFHRVIKDFMIQGGDPNSKDDNWSDDGMGGPGYKFEDEFNSEKLVRGSLAMANSGSDTNGSQFFIVTKEATPWLDGKHTNFGKVTEGMDVVDKIEKVETNEKNHPTEDVVIEDIELIEK